MTALRRADWRFLLPESEHGRWRHLVLLGGRDLVARLGGLAERISTDPAAIPDADAVVIMADSDAELGALLPQVSPRAVAYVEVDRRRAGRRFLSPARLAAMLRRAGLAPTACHWVVPDFDRARRHIPVDAPGPLAWYLDSLQTAGSRLAVAADAGVRLLARAGGGHLARLIPCYAMTATGWERDPGPVGVLAPIRAPVAMLTSGQDDGSRVVLLPFENGGRAPSRVVKVPRLASFDAHTEREQRTLAELRARLPASLRPSLPEPLGLRRWNDTLVATESYAPGVPLVVSSGRYGAPFATAREDLRYAVEWLTAFHLATRHAGAVWDERLAATVLARVEPCRALFPADSPVHRMLDGVMSASARLTGRSVPMVPVHNDLGPWNVHRDGARVTVIDWELGDATGGERVGPGACDLFYFLTYWSFRVRHLRTRSGESRGTRELFVEPARGGPSARAAHEEIERYAKALDLDRALLPVLLVITWVDRAVERVERARMAGTLEAARADNAYARFLEVLSERAPAWFAEGRWP